MNTWLDNMLAKAKVQEMLEEAANARAGRKAHKTNSQTGDRKISFVPAAIATVSLWILRKLSAS